MAKSATFNCFGRVPAVLLLSGFSIIAPPSVAYSRNQNIQSKAFCQSLESCFVSVHHLPWITPFPKWKWEGGKGI